MVVWGWMPGLYVETGIPPGTRHAVCHFVIDPGPSRDRLRASFLGDIQREAPDVIVDAIADGCFRWGWGRRERLDSFPELALLVQRDYTLVEERSFGEGGDPVRVYVRRR